MFQVMKRSEECYRYADFMTVYAVKEEDGDMQFLFFQQGEWKWVNATDYMPAR